VYERRSAQQKAEGKGTVKAKAKAKAAPKAKSPKTAESKPAAAAPVQLAAVLTPPSDVLADLKPAPQFSADDFRRPVDDMSGALLKAFARRIGIQQRDVDGLTEDRLRQNCKAMQLAHLED
jgi:hypothetical protein